jgi:pimeloyl-ACP methyl ester carboxylesterase
MNVVLRWFTLILIGIVVVAIALTATALVYGRVSEWRIAAATRIDTPNGIESLENVEIGGVEQTIYLRGHDQNKPVMLFVHGGPGAPEMHAARDFGLQLEEHFIVVHWDQRGAGNSCTSAVPDESLHLEQYLLDTVELVNLLRKRFDVEKIYLVGHSWGSVLGVLAAQRHPELFHAYVGIGQVVNMQRGEDISYRFAWDRAKAEGNEEALAELATVHPPYATTKELMTQRTWLSHYHGDSYKGGGMAKFARGVLLSPEYSIGKKLSFYGCAMNSLDQAWDDLQDLDFIRDVPELDLPVYFFTGRHDYNTPFELVEEFSRTLDAPHNEIVWFENSAHMPNLEEPELYQNLLINKVLPETLRAQGS